MNNCFNKKNVQGFRRDLEVKLTAELKRGLTGEFRYLPM